MGTKAITVDTEIWEFFQHMTETQGVIAKKKIRMYLESSDDFRRDFKAYLKQAGGD